MKFDDIILQLNEGTVNSLNLAEKQLTNSNIYQLTDVLRDNQTLTELDLSNNYLGNSGAQALAEMLRNNCTLTFLNIANNDISGLGAQALGKALPSNHTLLRLNLSGNLIDSKNEAYYKQAWQKHLQEQESIQQAACKGDQEILITFFQQHQLFPLNILLLLVEYNHEQLAKKWADYWSSVAFVFQDEKGDTPLHKAIANQHASLTGWLMAKGVPLDILNKQKQTPFSLSTTPSFKNQCFFSKGIHHYLGIATEKDEEKAEKCYQRLVNVIPNLSVEWLFKLTKFLTNSKLEKIDMDLGLINDIEIPPLLPLDSLSQVLSMISEKLNPLFNEKGYTFFHLIALRGSVEWCKALQEATEKNVNGLSQLFELIPKKDSQGFYPSKLARQQAKFIAEDKKIKTNSAEAAQNKTLARYHACEIILRKIEEKMQLDLILSNQRAQKKIRLDYKERTRALKENIDLLRWQPQTINQNLMAQYAKILQQFWSAKQYFIVIYNQKKEVLRWHQDFEPFSISSPSQTLINFQNTPPSSWLKIRASIKGPVCYIHYQYECALQWLNFYKANNNADLLTKEVYISLEETFNQLVIVYQLYENLLKKTINVNDKKLLLSTPTLLLQAYRSPAFVVPLATEDQLLSPADKLSYFLNKGKRIEGMAGAGTSPVFSIQGVHYKRNPHAPGIEFMVSSLGKVLTGEGAIPTELLKIIGADGIPYVYQASHTIQGKDLQSVLIHHPECIDKIRLDNFTAVVILGMLTDPQDGKPDNYMVEFSQDNQGNINQIDILGIDNDIAFSDTIISQHAEGEKAGQYIMNIKNVIYFFPQMMQPIEASFRNKLLEKQPEFILLEWLQLLLVKNKEYEALLTEGIFTLEEYGGDAKTSKRGLQLPIKVNTDTMARIYRKLKQLHAILNEQPNVTLWNLLRLVEPEVATHYAKIKAQYPDENFGCDIMKCITALYEENVTNGKELMWFRAQLDMGYTHNMTSLVLKTAEEFGFEDNRTTSLKDSFINVLKCLAYEDFKGILAPVLYETLEALIKEAELQDLLTTALAHNCGACVYWLWQESIIEHQEIQTHCESLKKYSLLHFFTQNRHLEGVKLLMIQGVYPVNICNRQGYTPLHIAASVGDCTILNYLIENKAYVNAKTTLGKTALMMAESRCKQMNEHTSQKGDKKYADIIASLKKAISFSSPTKFPTTSRFNFLSDPQQSSPKSVDSPSEQTDFKP